MAEDVTSDITNQVASPATTDVPPRGTSVDARLQALVQRILSQTVKLALRQPVDQATDTQSSKRQKTQLTAPSGSKDGGFKKPPFPTVSGKKGTGPIVAETRKCRGCHEPGHYQQSCHRKQGICYGCGLKGHRMPFCPRSGRGPADQPTLAPRPPVPKIEYSTLGQMVGEGRMAEDVTSDVANQVASPATADVPPGGTSVDARLQALVQRILSQTVKLALRQPVDQARGTQSRKRQKTQSAAPSGSKDGGFKKPRCPTGSGKKSTGPNVAETLKCYGCHEPGHYQADCPRKRTKCFGCGVTGHRRPFCPRSLIGPIIEYPTPGREVGVQIDWIERRPWWMQGSWDRPF